MAETETIKEFDDSDNESLPDVTNVFNVRSDPKSTEISKGDIVWAKFKKLYWPALVRSVYKKEKKVSVWYTDDPGKTFKLPLKKVCTFYDAEMVRKIKKDVREAGCVVEHEGVTFHARKYLQRKRNGYVDDPMKFFDQTYPFYLMEEHLRKNPGVDVNGIKIPPLYIDHRKKYSKKTARELTSSNIDSDIEVVSCDNESNAEKVPKDYLSKVSQALSASIKEDENIDNIVNFVRSGKADDYLETAKEFDDSDNESLPDVTKVFSVRSDPKSTEISKGDIVWAKFKKLYWPALVRSVYKKEKKVSVWYTDDPGKTFKLPLKKVCTFYDAEMVRKIKKDVREAGCVEEHEGLTFHARKYLQRKRNGYVDDPMKFFDQTYPFYLMEEHLRKNPGVDVNGIKIPPLYIDHRKKNSKKTARVLTSSNIDSDIEAVSSDNESNAEEIPNDYLSKVSQALSASIKEDENIDNIVNLVKSGKADDYLEKILTKCVPSKHQDAYEKEIASNKRNTNPLSYTGPIHDDRKLREIMNYLIPLHEKISQSQRQIPSRRCKEKVVNYPSLDKKRGNLNCASYISSVWLPEAIIYAMSVIYTVSLDDARQLFEKKSSEDTKDILFNLLESEATNLNSELTKEKSNHYHRNIQTCSPLKKLCVRRTIQK